MKYVKRNTTITEYYSVQKNTFELQYNKMKSKYNNYTSPCQEQKTNPSLHHKQK